MPHTVMLEATVQMSPAGLRAARKLRRVGVYLELGKARLSALVVVTAGVGFVLASRSAAGLDWSRLIWTVLGVALAALGANALNEWIEVEPDSRMNRTCRRPLPTRRLRNGAALAFGLIAGAGGPLLLGVSTNWLASGLALLTLLIYVLAYTPLKKRTPTNTLVGAIVGGLPPMVGWAAGAGRLDAPAWILGAILFIWQVPHFLALAWLYREDYARGGFRMLPSVDPEGHLTGLYTVIYSLALVPLTLLLALSGVTGVYFATGAVLLGAGFVAAAISLKRQRSNGTARRVFLASVIYLPLLLALSVADRGPTPTDRARGALAAAGPVEVAGPQAASAVVAERGSAEPDRGERS